MTRATKAVESAQIMTVRFWTEDLENGGNNHVCESHRSQGVGTPRPAWAEAGPGGQGRPGASCTAQPSPHLPKQCQSSAPGRRRAEPQETQNVGLMAGWSSPCKSWSKRQWAAGGLRWAAGSETALERPHQCVSWRVEVLLASPAGSDSGDSEG